MAEQSGFFNALEKDGTYDRVYDASDFANYFAMFIGNGVFVNPADQLKVIAKNGLTVTVKAGSAFIDGYWYKLTEDMDITLKPNATAYAITDVICCRLNKRKREVSIQTKQSVTSILPVNNGTINELVLCTISLGVGVSTITDAMITDRRPFETYCGFVSGTVEQIQTGELFAQFTQVFNKWFETIKGQLSTDVAGNLQLQIDNINKEKEKLETQLYNNVDIDLRGSEKTVGKVILQSGSAIPLYRRTFVVTINESDLKSWVGTAEYYEIETGWGAQNNNIKVYNIDSIARVTAGAVPPYCDPTGGEGDYYRAFWEWNSGNIFVTVGKDNPSRPITLILTVDYTKD